MPDSRCLEMAGPNPSPPQSAVPLPRRPPQCPPNPPAPCPPPAGSVCPWAPQHLSDALPVGPFVLVSVELGSHEQLPKPAAHVGGAHQPPREPSLGGGAQRPLPALGARMGCRGLGAGKGQAGSPAAEGPWPGTPAIASRESRVGNRESGAS